MKLDFLENRSLTLQTVGVEQVLALLVAFDSTLCAAHALASDPPQQPLAFVAVGGCGGCPHLEVVWGGAGYGIDESLKGFLIHMTFLEKDKETDQQSTLDFHC